MKKKEIIELIKQHKSDIKQIGVKTLAIFGSVVREEEKPDSDIDFLVEFEGSAKFDQFMDLKFYLEDLLHRPVDLVTNKALKPRLRPYIEKEALYVA